MRAELVLFVSVVLPLTGLAESRPIESYESTVRTVASMVRDPAARRHAQGHGLQLANVLWEDTGRWQGSALGPNISDVTIEVLDSKGRGTLMPVLRFPNFADRTADVRLDRFYLRVGNERNGAKARVITLAELLRSPARYLSAPEHGKIRGGSLLAARDTHALVSAQAAFLPVPRRGEAKFHPVIFNYQSSAKNPAVLTLLVTRQGTSVTIVDNTRDTVTGRGQRLFFNAEGERAPLTAERLSDVIEKGVTSNGESDASLGADANLLMLVQVPLKQREAPRRLYDAPKAKASLGGVMPMQEAAERSADLEVAVLGHGPAEGPFIELDGLTLERDPRFPVRVTVQFYQATTTSNVGAALVGTLAKQIALVYEKGDYVGSLVVPSESDTRRPTNWDGVTRRPDNAAWWRSGDAPSEPIGIR